MMPSKHKLRLKRQRRRQRARARAAQPVAVRLDGADILKSLDTRFDDILGPRTLKEALVGALVSQS